MEKKPFPTFSTRKGAAQIQLGVSRAGGFFRFEGYRSFGVWRLHQEHVEIFEMYSTVIHKFFETLQREHKSWVIKCSH